MPTYHYRCSDCGHEESVFQKMSDPNQHQCTQVSCDGTMGRQVRSGNFKLKGGGWYKDGYLGADNQAPSDDTSTGSED